MTRFDRFMELPSHPIYGPKYTQLLAYEKQFVRKFLVETVTMNADDYATKVARLFLDELVKPKHHGVIIEILASCNVVPRQ